ncbi:MULTISPECIES: hypothetical protein [Mycobacterium]|uniref:Mammalian cell entry protein n=1 Tax=Mycobacterium kiyosense TaxID=2871094 RepID=A0A9P3UUE8_9MYCO|nr:MULTISPECIES: hypothetical protein [Mycobacterium]BDB40001.1 hypothetical protein IWGMT90018_04470 [Mycobacterium kiyosense]BDE11850.1 hypothetical protein MKCMC460_07100 [Mycobacterium sp. 20KCMC460]GLB85448.1 hypothetical protein SRL2020028_47040 [Mycobacterium kiyosense]GLB89977.1 hypothetical protein SRL2020130_27940 [Mycobacterium kiyosense]GLB95480.1 hypothetical protein SRL2020226_22560 [Mycobacterium kiyosense]
MPDQDKTAEPSEGEPDEAVEPADVEEVAAKDDTDVEDEDGAVEEDVDEDGAMFSGYGIASTVLGLVSVAAVVLAVLIWTTHRDDSGERAYLTRVMQAATDWSTVLINMNTSNLDASLQRLHEGTVGDLNTDFEAAIGDYRKLAQKLQAKSAGQVAAVAIDTVHRDLDTVPGSPRPVVTTKLPAFASRTDSVLVVATSVAENAGGKPQVVQWNLRLDVSQIDGKLMISKLESLR